MIVKPVNSSFEPIKNYRPLWSHYSFLDKLNEQVDADWDKEKYPCQLPCQVVLKALKVCDISFNIFKPPVHPVFKAVESVIYIS